MDTVDLGWPDSVIHNSTGSSVFYPSFALLQFRFLLHREASFQPDREAQVARRSL